MTWTLTVFNLKSHNQSFPIFASRKLLKSLSSPQCTVTDSCFKQVMQFCCRFPEFKAKQCWCIVPKNQPLENHESPLTHNNKHLLMSKAEAYESKTHYTNSEITARCRKLLTLDVLSLSRKFRNFGYDAVFQSRIAMTQWAMPTTAKNTSQLHEHYRSWEVCSGKL